MEKEVKEKEELVGVHYYYLWVEELSKHLRAIWIMLLPVSLAIFFMGIFDFKGVSSLTKQRIGYSLFDIGLVMTGASVLILLMYLYVKKMILTPRNFNDWVFEIAQSRIGADLLLFKGKKVFLTYDRKIKETDKKSFVEEISDKSVDFTYYLEGTRINDGVIIVSVTPRSPIPKAAMYNEANNNCWNIVPLGKCVNNANQSVTPIGWYLNDQNIDNDYMKVVPSTSIMICGGTGSGKSVLEQTIVAHISKFSDNFQAVGVDCKRVEFNLLRGVKGIKSVALDPLSASIIVKQFADIMMDRFKFMEEMKVNNVYKIKDKEVDYYDILGEVVQFDEIFEVEVEVKEEKEDEGGFSPMMYSRSRKPKVVINRDTGRKIVVNTIENIYKLYDEEDVKVVYFNESSKRKSAIAKKDIKITKGIYKPKALVFIADELNELMSSDDMMVVDTVRTSMGSIARLGRAAGVHLVLAMQRPNGNTVSSDLKNNIQMSVLLGGFDSSASGMLFDKDVSHLSKPEIKGRGFVQTGNEIIETQTFYTEPEKYFEFDKSLKISYQNPTFEAKYPDLSFTPFVEEKTEKKKLRINKA